MKEIKNSAEFSELLNEDKPVLLDFYADWCGPCRSLLPTIEELANKHKEEVTIVKVNVDNNAELASKFQVRSIPALFFLKNGAVIEKLNGLQQRSVLEDKIAALKAA